jgi:hypothetical protein
MLMLYRGIAPEQLSPAGSPARSHYLFRNPRGTAVKGELHHHNHNLITQAHRVFCQPVAGGPHINPEESEGSPVPVMFSNQVEGAPGPSRGTGGTLNLKNAV